MVIVWKNLNVEGITKNTKEKSIEILQQEQLSLHQSANKKENYCLIFQNSFQLGRKILKSVFINFYCTFNLYKCKHDIFTNFIKYHTLMNFMNSFLNSSAVLISSSTV